MPILDGLSAARTIKKMGKQVDIIGLTANVDENTKREAHEVGMMSVLSKPTRLADLKSLLVATLRRRLGQSPSRSGPSSTIERGDKNEAFNSIP